MRLTTNRTRARHRPGPAALALACALCALAAGAAEAGKARDYLNAPVDTWVSFLNFGYSEPVSPVVGGAEFDVSDIETDVVSQSLILSRIVDVGGRTGGLSVILPLADIDAAVGPFAAGDSGLGDIGVVAEVNLFGAPALSREEFRAWTPETFASIHVVATAPTGSYDADRRVNVGANRWSVTSTLNYSYTPDAGTTWLEAYASVSVFTDNDDAPGPAARLSQDPLVQVEGHASRNVTRDLWLSADLTYATGGATEIDGLAQGNAADTLRLGAGFGWRIGTLGQILFAADAVVARPDDQPDGWGLRLTRARSW